MGVGAMPPVGVQGTESPLVGLGDEAPQKLEYYCILCRHNDKSVYMNTKMQKCA